MKHPLVITLEDGTIWMPEVSEPRTAGGPGSGNYGHAGRPGEVGGSTTEDGGKSDVNNEAMRARLAAHPMIVYHGTSLEAARAIMKEGLKPSGGPGADAWAQAHGWDDVSETMRMSEVEIADRKASVFVTPSRVTAQQFAQLAAEMHPGSEPVILTVLVPEDALKPDVAAPTIGGKTFKGTIPPEWITKMERVSREPVPFIPIHKDKPTELFDTSDFEDWPGPKPKVRAAAAGDRTFYLVLLTEQPK